jgi:hypothetical protein
MPVDADTRLTVLQERVQERKARLAAQGILGTSSPSPEKS